MGLIEKYGSEDGMKNDFVIENNLVYIKIVNKKKEIFQTVIDKDDLDKLVLFGRTWYIKKQWRDNQYYVYCSIINGKRNEKYTYISYALHQFIMDIDPLDRKNKTDHINYDRLDNRKENLRITTKAGNCQHRGKINSNNKIGHRNICKVGNKLYVQLEINRKNRILGKFNPDELNKAISFAEEMRQKYYGEFAGVG